MSLKKYFAVAALCVFAIPAVPARAEVYWWPLPEEAYAFGKRYPEAQALLFAFDYGHALTYERLILRHGKIKDPESFERQLLAEILAILKNPPQAKTEEADIAPHYVYAFPLLINLFDWSHYLHQFVLDAMVSRTKAPGDWTGRVNFLIDRYLAEESIAITPVCKTMLFMDSHFFSKAFRRTYPSLNLLIWSYHWFQIRLYEALMPSDEKERDKGVAQTVAEFKRLVSNLPDSAEFDMMPETAVVAPLFSSLFSRLVGAFDNVHMLHDVLSDILVSDRVSESDFMEQGLRVGAMALDPESFRSAKCGQKR